MTVQRDAVTWALSIQAEYERAERADDEFRSENVDRGPRCGECRLGLGVHNLADPLCEARVASPGAPTPTKRGEQ